MTFAREVSQKHQNDIIKDKIYLWVFAKGNWCWDHLPTVLFIDQFALDFDTSKLNHMLVIHESKYMHQTAIDSLSCAKNDDWQYSSKKMRSEFAQASIVNKPEMASTM